VEETEARRAEGRTAWGNRAINTCGSYSTAETKAILAWRVGKRDGLNADEFIEDLSRRTNGAVSGHDGRA
jgi:hypothetical protein